MLGLLVELGMYAFFVSLLYKQAAVGILSLLVIVAAGSFIKIQAPYLKNSPSLLGSIYVCMATVTAFQVSFGEGAYRAVQFILLVAAATLASNYLFVAGQARRLKILKNMAIIVSLIFLHVILYHISIGRFSPWKYLFDTKSAISMIIIVVFVGEDVIVRRLGIVGWILCIGITTVLVLISGERKAYLLLVVIFLLCRLPVLIKMTSAAIGAVLLIAYIAVAPADSNIVRQINTIFVPDRVMQISEFYLIESIGDQSSIIRDFVNRNAQEQFRNNLWFGLGATGYQRWSRQAFGEAVDSGGLSMNVHGELNRVPVENGIVGIFVALAYLLAIGTANFRYYKKFNFRNVASTRRLLAYSFAFVLCYSMFEALDTTMLTLILFLGFEASRLQYQQVHRGSPLSRNVVQRFRSDYRELTS